VNLPDSVRRALRTGFQTFLGVLVVTFAASVVAEGTFFLAGSTYVRLLDAAGIAALGGLVGSYSQNALEDRGTIPAPLKLPTPAPAVNDPLND